MSDSLGNKVASAAKWSTITEVAAKIVAPVSGMIMARILTPEAYGAMAAISIIISFTELFTDAGFKTYIVQHEFANGDDRRQSTNVAFWTNLTLSLFAWLVIILFRNQLAALVGSPQLGLGLAVACAGIPLAAFSSIQTANYQRQFDFKTLFYCRLVGIFVPFFVNIPLALITRNYWALIIGSLVSSSITAVILTIKSTWKPKFEYSFPKLKEMLSFCLWLIVDSVLVWATSYIDTFIIARSLNEHYLGLYRVSCNIVGQLMAIITASVLPVLFAALSRLQNDKDGLRRFLIKSQKLASIIILPIGVGIWTFRGLITEILLGAQWLEAANFVGIWGFMSAITIIFNSFCTKVYPAIGKPKLSILAQCLHLIVLLPAVLISATYGFEALYWTRSLVRFELILVNVIITYFVIQLKPSKMVANILPELAASLIMGVIGIGLLHINDAIPMACLAFGVCCAVYFGILYLVPKERLFINEAIKLFISKFRKK